MPAKVYQNSVAALSNHHTGTIIYFIIKIIVMKSKSFLVLAGLAAYAYYKYSKLSDEQKRDLTGNIKEKGKKLFDQYVPPNVQDNLKKYI